jgi:hypothetical protein
VVEASHRPPGMAAPVPFMDEDTRVISAVVTWIEVLVPWRRGRSWVRHPTPALRPSWGRLYQHSLRLPGADFRALVRQVTDFTSSIGWPIRPRCAWHATLLTASPVQ